VLQQQSAARVDNSICRSTMTDNCTRTRIDDWL